MLLREQRWRDQLKLNNIRRRLPKMYKRYTATKIWEEQLLTIEQDLRRMPTMNYTNVVKLVKRHAATTPWHPYTQGHLYLIYTMGLVLRDEASLFWGYRHICGTLYRYGPDTGQATQVVPDWVFAPVCKSTLERNMWDNLVRFRWIYIMFGQTFVTPETICAAWDYVLLDTHRMHCMCAALLAYGVKHVPVRSEICALEEASHIISVRIDTVEAAADVLARAHIIQQSHA